MIADRYTLVREIGRGASGAVWLGRDERLGRDVALKRIGMLPGADETDLARAEREARLSARLHHPHVVAVFDVVDGADGGRDHRWLVMEHVEGRDLGRVLREDGAVGPDRAADLLLPIADVLVQAHEAGIVHRDVKPSNVLVDQRGRAKLTDFGIARVQSDPSLTQTGMVTGSPTYLAPEVASGARGDEASDVWSLGATLFHVLAGRPPYETGEVLATLFRVVNDEPPRLGVEAGWLAPALEGMLVKDPSLRWTMPQVRDFLADRRVPEGAPIAPAPPPRAGTGAGAGAAAATTAVVGAGAASSRPSPRLLAALAVGAVAVLGAVLLLGGLGDGDGAVEAGEQTSEQASPSPTEEPEETPAPPTVEGMEAFIEDYVVAVGEDPARSWEMLTPKFQRESGGFEQYRDFWEPASNGRVTEFVEVDPDELRVAYQVRYDTWDNGPGPTVLQLAYDDGEYAIDGESSAGFVPAG